MPPASPVPGWSSGEVCRLTIATRSTRPTASPLVDGGRPDAPDGLLRKGEPRTVAGDSRVPWKPGSPSSVPTAPQRWRAGHRAATGQPDHEGGRDQHPGGGVHQLIPGEVLD